MCSYHIFTFVVLVYTKFLRDFGEFSNASPSSPFFKSVLKHLKPRVSFLNCETIIDYKMANTILLYNLLLFFYCCGKSQMYLEVCLIEAKLQCCRSVQKSDCFLSLSFFLYYQIRYQILLMIIFNIHTEFSYQQVFTGKYTANIRA